MNLVWPAVSKGPKGTTLALFLIKWLGLYMLQTYGTIIYNKRGNIGDVKRVKVALECDTQNKNYS